MASSRKTGEVGPVEHNFYYMLAGLILLFFSISGMQMYSGETARILMLVGLAMSLGISVWSLAGSRVAFTLGALFAVLTAALVVAAIRTESLIQTYFVLGLQLLFWLTSAWIAGRTLLAPGVVDLNRIAGSVCLYLIAGFVWAYLYIFQDLIVPGSFNGINASILHEQLLEFAYFSFVTLTTLGYGEITPAASFARAFVTLEAIFGQLYVAILVAALVGIHISSRLVKQDKKG